MTLTVVDTWARHSSHKWESSRGATTDVSFGLLSGVRFLNR